MGVHREIANLLRTAYVPIADGGNRENFDEVFDKVRCTSAKVWGEEKASKKEEIVASQVIEIIKRARSAR